MSGEPADRTSTETLLAAALDRAAALFRSGKLADASQAYAAIARDHPRDIRAFYSLAVIELRRNRPADARRQLERARRIDPKHFGVLHNLGVARQQTRDWAGAATAFSDALALRPEATETRHGLALVLMVLGRTDEALAHHRTLAEATETRLRALGRIALLRPGAIAPGELEEMRRAASEPRIDADVRAALHFAVGAVLEQAGEDDAAFGAYADGAALKCALLDRTGARAAAAEANEASVQTLVRLFPAAAAPAATGSPSAAPIFIVGMPRSGSTLIEQILAAHPDVQDLGEFAHLGDLIDYGDRAFLLHGKRAKAAAEAYLVTARAFGWSGRGRFVDKTLENYLHIGAIARLFPHATILHSVRDPVDTCLSCFRQLFAAGNETLYDLADIGREYRRYRRIMDHWQAILPGRVIDVRYEALVADPEAGIRALVTEAAGLPWNDACLSFHARERPVATASAGQVRQPINQDGVQRWRRHAHRLGPLMEALGEFGPPA